jgi:hypothetical protein
MVTLSGLSNLADGPFKIVKDTVFCFFLSNLSLVYYMNAIGQPNTVQTTSLVTIVLYVAVNHTSCIGKSVL